MKQAVHGSIAGNDSDNILVPSHSLVLNMFIRLVRVEELSHHTVVLCVCLSC